MQVYAVLYDRSGRFLLGRKPDKGYYFYNPRTGQGKLVPQGQRLNGAGNWALPGGELGQDEQVARGARREFFEETGEDIVPSRTTERRFDHDTYAAAYFEVSSDTFDNLANAVRDVNLPAGLAAAGKVISGEITSYDQIGRQFPAAPRDNELELAQVWNVNDPGNWMTIQSWRNDRVIGWYYEILAYLKNSVLVLSVVLRPA